MGTRPAEVVAAEVVEEVEEVAEVAARQWYRPSHTICYRSLRHILSHLAESR
jgi:hypothetical protein